MSRPSAVTDFSQEEWWWTAVTLTTPSRATGRMFFLGRRCEPPRAGMIATTGARSAGPIRALPGLPGARQRPQRQELLAAQADGLQLRHPCVGAVEGGQDDAVHAVGHKLAIVADRLPQKLPTRALVEHAHGLQPELPQRQVCELGRLPGAVERDPLHPASQKGGEAVAQRP